MAQPVVEFLKLYGGSILSRKLEEALQVIDDRIQRTVLVIGGAAELHAGRFLVLKLVLELLDQPGFANPWLAAQQHHLACSQRRCSSPSSSSRPTKGVKPFL